MKSVFDFSDVGLNTRDKRVYEALLATPDASLRKIAELTGINRGSVYESVKQLASSGLVASSTSGQRQSYIAQDPELIIELLKERQQVAVRAEASAAQYITTLRSQASGPEDSGSLAVQFDGDEGVAAVLRDVLKTMRASQDKHYRVLSSKRVRQYIYHNFTNYTQQRVKARIRVSVIAVGEGGQTDPLSDRVWLPNPDAVSDNCYTIIYGQKTAFISLSDTNVLRTVVVDDQGIANLQKLQFRKLWDSLG